MSNQPTETEQAFYEIMHHPGMFMEFITPVDEHATRRLPMVDWFEVDNWGKVRPYQLPALPWDHMLPDEVPIDEATDPRYEGVDRISAGTCHVIGGRKTSKSWDLEHDLIETAFIHSGEKTILTSLDDNHLEERWESVWQYLRHPLIKDLVTRKRKGDPYGMINWYNAHVTLAIYESTTGSGDPYLGKHFHRALIDEFQLSTEEGMKKFHDATSEEGCVVRSTSVSDGRRGTPAHQVRNDPTKAKNVHIRPQLVSERWTPATKRAAIEAYGGEGSQGYQTNVLAGEGEPTASVWDMRQIRRCMAVFPEDVSRPLDSRRLIACPVLYLSGRELDSNRDRIITDLNLPPRRTDDPEVWVSMDVGKRAHPSVIGIWGVDGDFVPHLWGMVILIRVEYDDQADIIEAILERYGVMSFGIDATGGGGDAVYEKLARKGMSGVKLVHVDFRRTLERPMPGEKKRGRRKAKEGVRKVGIKNFVTVRLQMRFRDKRIELLDDIGIRLEFQTEVAKEGSKFSPVTETYYGPKGDHRIDMVRVLEWMLYSLSGSTSDGGKQRSRKGPMIGLLGRL